MALAQEVALTFDDLPRHGALPSGWTRLEIAKRLVRALQEAEVPRPFGFINAQKLEDDPALMEVLETWRSAGFPLGNHTYSHIDLHASSPEEFAEDVALNEPVLEELMGEEDWRWLRFPFLREGDTLEKRAAVKRYLSDRNYRIALASLDFEDYLWNAPYARCLDAGDEESLAWLRSSYLETAAEFIELGREMTRLGYGRDVKHIMLLHVGAFNAEMLPELISLLRGEGFEFIELEAAVADPVYSNVPDVASKWGLTLGEQLSEHNGIAVPEHNRKPYEKLREICR